MSKVIFILGQSGSGKDTMTENINKALAEKGEKFMTLNSGQELRNFGQTGTFTANRARAVNEAGSLAPSFVIIGCWFNKLNQDFDGSGAIVWNGSPRSIKEVEVIAQLVRFYDLEAHAVYIKLSDEECRRRMEERAKTEDREETRTLEAIERKIKFFHEEVIKVIEIMKEDEKFVVHEIDGLGSRDEVFERAKLALGL